MLTKFRFVRRLVEYNAALRGHATREPAKANQKFRETEGFVGDTSSYSETFEESHADSGLRKSSGFSVDSREDDYKNSSPTGQRRILDRTVSHAADSSAFAQSRDTEILD